MNLQEPRRKTYQTKEWKERSREYVKDKSCEWCGHKAGDIVDVGVKKVKIFLVPHHRVKKRIGLRTYKRLANKHFKEYFKLGKNREEWQNLYDEAINNLVSGVEEKDIKKRLRYIWDQNHRSELDELYDRYKQEARLDYLDLTPDKVIVLCNRCHYAREKGFVLCKVCKLSYHRPRYSVCYACSKDR